MTDETECTPEEQSRRLETCKGCDRFAMNPDGTTKCTACDCSLSLLITFVSQKCPLERW